MKIKITGTYSDYKSAVREAFARPGTMCNPSVHWTPRDGFIATPAANLVPMDDDEIEIDIAAYYDGVRTLSGTRREYTRVRLALRAVLAGVENSIDLAMERALPAPDSDDFDQVADFKAEIIEAESNPTPHQHGEDRLSVDDGAGETVYVREDQLPENFSMCEVAEAYAAKYDHNGGDRWSVARIVDLTDEETHDFAFNRAGQFEWDTEREWLT